MCTSIVFNGNKTIVGWNLDILDMEHRVVVSDSAVVIEVLDKTEGFMPLFGANCRGDFVGMPTCWPYDKRSDKADSEPNVIMLDIDLLTMKKSFEEIKAIVSSGRVCSVDGLTFMSALSNKNGDVMHVVPGQGYKYYEKPRYSVLTNFSPFKGESETHPWMGFDRYNRAKQMLLEAEDDFGVEDCFAVLKATAQEVCPTVVSMVFDVSENTVFWCKNRDWDNIFSKKLV